MYGEQQIYTQHTSVDVCLCVYGVVCLCGEFLEWAPHSHSVSICYRAVLLDDAV